MKILNPADPRWLEEVLTMFSRDEPVALPTETVYGLAAPIDNAVALARVFDIKNRPRFNPLIIHFDPEWDLSRWAKPTKTDQKLRDIFWPGPLSLMLEKTDFVPDLCTAASRFMVARSPAHEIFQKVLHAVGVPIAAPSANTTTEVSPTTAEKVALDLGARGLKLVIDGGRCSVGIESTIVRTSPIGVEIVREGAVSREMLLQAGFKVAPASENAERVAAPGRSGRHYAPRVPLYFCQTPDEWKCFQAPDSRNTLFLKVLETDAPGLIPLGRPQVRVLSSYDHQLAAYELFETLREAETKFTAVVALKTADHNLGRAINDRLRRASTLTQQNAMSKAADRGDALF